MSEDTLVVPFGEIPPEEPLFLLRGSDPVAFLLVTMWAYLHEKLADLSQEQIMGAILQAFSMEAWARARGASVDLATDVWMTALREAQARLPEATRQTLN